MMFDHILVLNTFYGFNAFTACLQPYQSYSYILQVKDFIESTKWYNIYHPLHVCNFAAMLMSRHGRSLECSFILQYVGNVFIGNLEFRRSLCLHSKGSSLQSSYSLQCIFFISWHLTEHSFVYTLIIIHSVNLLDKLYIFKQGINSTMDCTIGKCKKGTQISACWRNAS